MSREGKEKEMSFKGLPVYWGGRKGFTECATAQSRLGKFKRLLDGGGKKE